MIKQWTTVPLGDIRIRDPFWDRYTNLIPQVVLPYQWRVLNDQVPDAPPSHCLRNFRIAAGEEKGERGGTVFQDSDAYKWLEAVANSLASRPDPALEESADRVIQLIGGAQGPDGYLNTYYTLVEPQGRWRNLSEGHELYCAGYLMEAGVAYHRSTGKRDLLDIGIRFADLICREFGPGVSQRQGCPGHPEVEMALVQLARATGNTRYLDTARYFVEIRGGSPNHLLEERRRPDYQGIFPEFAAYTPEYAQAHKPVREQDTAEGHAVRAVYLYSAMADIAAETGDEELLERCKLLWNNMVERRMYITGSIGSSGFFERFTSDYDLPNDAGYSETCASIALAMFGQRMAAVTRDASYMDVVERALYNTVRAGISLEGDRYFYVNPLEVWPDIGMEATSRAHVKAERQKWFDVACCPTNVARTFTGLGNYLYGLGEEGVYLNLLVQSEAKIQVAGDVCHFRLQTDFPRQGAATLTVEGSGEEAFSLFLRVPAYAENYTVRCNDNPVEGQVRQGYLEIRRRWSGDTVSIRFDMTPRFLFGNPLVRGNCGKVALLRGPEVYCLEEADNGAPLAGIYADTAAPVTEKWEADLLGGTTVLRFRGKQLAAKGEGSACREENLAWTHRTYTAVPYGSWGNRKPGEMLVWMHALSPFGDGEK